MKKIMLLFVVFSFFIFSFAKEKRPRDLDSSVEIYGYSSFSISTEKDDFNFDWFRVGAYQKINPVTIGIEVDPAQRRAIDKITKAYARKRFVLPNEDEVFITTGKFLNPIRELFTPLLGVRAPRLNMSRKYQLDRIGASSKLEMEEGSFSVSYWAQEKQFQSVIKTRLLNSSASIAAFARWGTKPGQKNGGIIIDFHKMTHYVSSKVGYCFDPNQSSLNRSFIKNSVYISNGLTLISQIEVDSYLSFTGIDIGASLQIKNHSWLNIYKTYNRDRGDSWLVRISYSL